jgi:hypothetical protein
VQGYLLLDIWAFDAAQGTVVFSSRDAAQPDEISAGISSLGSGLAAVILGREWALVRFVPEPSNSSLYVDGSLAAAGSAPALYLEPGTREVRISARGYRDSVRTVTLEARQENLLRETLEKEAAGTISLETTPPGAAVYLESVWSGRTPLTLEKPPEPRRGVLVLNGYYPRTVTLGPASADEVAVPLLPDIGSRDEKQKKARDDFYASFAWFAASVPLPLFSYALAIDFAVEQLDYLFHGFPSEASQAAAASGVFLAGYYTGVAVSASLFVWMVYRVIGYVAASNWTAG